MRQSLTGGVPVSLQWAVVGAVVVGIVGGICGLVVGLDAHPATAWFAVIELGLPAAIVGFVGGLTCGLVVEATRKLWRSRTP